MAKRKRLAPLGFEASAEAGSEAPVRSETRHPVTGVRPPIADMAGAASSAAALDEMAAEMQQAREGGRMVLAIPLDQIVVDHLARDRAALDPEDMAALVESLRLRGQQTPIELERIGPDRYGLISGWRRIRALGQLLAETGEVERFGTALALLRRPEQMADAYLAMVEENEIRSGLSFYERARIVDRAVAAGVFPDDRSALRGLFGSVPRARRSKIGSFLAIVRALDSRLVFPQALPERLGLRLAKGIEEEPTLAGRLSRALADPGPADADAERRLIETCLAQGAGRRGKAVRPASGQGGATGDVLEFRAAEDLNVIMPALGELVLKGAGVDEAFFQKVVEWLGEQKK